MRLILAFLLGAGLGLALDNSVTIHEASGSEQTARPLTLYRGFAQAEFPSGTFPKPRIGGSVPSAWQVDVKTTWPDGSIQMAYISLRLDLTASGSAVVDFVSDSNPCHLGNLATCQAAALTQQNMLDYDTGGGTGSWSATWEGTVNSITYMAAARTILNAAAWRWQLRGPVVSGIIVEDRSTALAYDFGWTYTGGAWTTPSSDSYKSLHPVYELRFYPDPDGAGALTAWGGVEVDAQIWNASSTRHQRFNSIDLVLKTGASEATTAYSATGKTYHTRSRRHKLAWSGTAPGAVVVDFNFAYLIHTKLIAPYDLSLATASTLADSTITTYDAELGSDEPQWCTDSSNCANWLKAVGTTGARGDIALIPRWYLSYLYLMGHSGTTTAKKLEVWQKLVLGNADAAGHAPVHYMETGTGRVFFSVVDTTDAFGRVGSINARTNGWNAGGSSEDTYMPPLCGSSPCDGRGSNGISNGSTGGWTAYGSTNYNSHAPAFYAIPAFLTGYHYYLTGLQFEAAYMLATENGCVTGYNSGCRHNMKGIFYYEANLRETPWALRNVFWAAVLTPDGDIEKAYFKDKLLNNVKFQEGVLQLTAGVHDPADTSCPDHVQTDGAVFQETYDLWCAGRNWWSSGQGGPGIPSSNPAAVPTYGYTSSSTTDGFHNTARHTAGFWVSYLAAGVGWMADTGAFLDSDSQPYFYHVRNALALYFAGRVLVGPKSMFLFRDIENSIGPSAGGICIDMADCAGAYVTTFNLAADMTDSQTTMVIDTTEIRNTGYSWLSTSWAKIGNEYIKLSGDGTKNSPVAGQTTVTIAKRGDHGSVAAAHSNGASGTWIPDFWDTYVYEYQGGYPVLARAALALLAKAPKIGPYSPEAAYRMFQGALPFQHYAGNPMWAFVPREEVQAVSAAGGTGTASLSWLAPSGGACKVYLSQTAPSSSSDAADASASNTGGLRQTYLASSLAAGTWYYRISCATARMSGTVTVN